MMTRTACATGSGGLCRTRCVRRSCLHLGEFPPVNRLTKAAGVLDSSLDRFTHVLGYAASDHLFGAASDV
jgi:hypothetical protein